MNRKNGNGVDGGWGASADPEQESMFMRRVLFVVLLAVSGSMGIWFLLTTLRGAEQARRILSATREPSEGPATYTVKLLEFPGDRQASAEAFMSTPLLRQLAGPHRCSLLRLPSGDLALCVGEFQDPDAPEMHELLHRFQEFREGEINFGRAAVFSYYE